VKIKWIWITALFVAGLGVSLANTGCDRQDSQQAAADKAAADKAAADKTAAAVAKALADRDAADKAAADAAAAQTAADKLAAQQKAEAGALPPDLVMMKAELSQGIYQTDIAIAKLEILSASTGDLDKPTEDALASIDALDKTTQSVMKRSADMRDRGAAYFDSWEQQLKTMSTPEVAAIAAKRKDELSAKYVEVLTNMQETRAAFDPFWADMKSIQDTLKGGINEDSAKALAPRIQAVKAKAVTVEERAAALAAKLNQIGVIYTQP
jgi:trimeric autotransporter adhesin